MKLTALAALAAAVALPVAAQTGTPRVDPQAAKQQVSIQAKADGKVTPKERAKIAKVQNKESKKISRKKHDKRTTAPAT